MPRKQLLPPHELAICLRLRAFRETTRIPRTSFALAAGVSGEKLTNCELGRSPVRYAVFKGIHREFLLNPQWLVENVGVTALNSPLDLSQVDEFYTGRELLSVIYEKSLRAEVHRLQDHVANTLLQRGGLADAVEQYITLLGDPASFNVMPENVLQNVITRLETALEKLKAIRNQTAKASVVAKRFPAGDKSD